MASHTSGELQNLPEMCQTTANMFGVGQMLSMPRMTGKAIIMRA